MAEGQHRMKPVAFFLLLLNLSMYVVVLGISGWAMNRIIDYGYWDTVTRYLIEYSLIAGVVGAGACLFAMTHAYSGHHGHPASASAATIAWSLTMLAFGFACKHIRVVKHDSPTLKSLEAFIIILAATMLIYLAVVCRGSG